MKNLLHRTKRDLHLVVHNNQQHAARLKRLALKRRYSTYQSESQEIKIMINLYGNLAAVSEKRTGQAVDNCRTAITAAVESYFSIREAQAAQVVKVLIGGKPLDGNLLSRVVSNQDLKELANIARDLIARELGKRFGITAVSPVLRLELKELQDIFDLINQWQKQKRKTVEISKQAGKWSKKAWNLAIEGIISNSLVADLACQADLGELLLNIMEVDPATEEYELTKGLVTRIIGLLTDLKLRIIHELNQQAAEIIYHMHDNMIGERLEDKIALLEEKLTDRALTINERA